MYFSCLLQTYYCLSTNEKLLVSWQFSGTYGVITNDSGWRKDVVNHCLEFGCVVDRMFKIWLLTCAFRKLVFVFHSWTVESCHWRCRHAFHYFILRLCVWMTGIHTGMACAMNNAQKQVMFTACEHVTCFFPFSSLCLIPFFNLVPVNEMVMDTSMS